jgi:tetratricopeptide (TPR) repeat protein
MSSTTLPPPGSAGGTGETPPSDAEAEAFVKSLVTTFKSSDAAVLNAAFNYDAMIRRAMLGIDVDEKTRGDIANDLRSLLTGDGGIGAGLAKLGARYRLLRVHRDGAEQRAMFRRATDGGIAYLDCILLRDADGKVRIGDFYDYGDGCLESRELHQQALCTAARTNPELLHQVSPADREYVAFEDTIRQMRQFIAAERFKEALDLRDKLPDVLKNHWRVLHEQLEACCGTAAECDETIRAYRTTCPDDPGVDLILMNHYVLHRQVDKALACIDRLDKAVGGDPFLDAERAGAYFLKGDLVAAKKYAQSAIAAEPDSASAQEILKAASLAENALPTGGPAKGLKLDEPSRGEPAGDEEAKTFAEKFANNVTANDTSAVNAGFDLAALYQRSIAGINLSEATRVGVESAFSNLIGPAIAHVFGEGSRKAQGGNFRLLRLHHTNGDQRALFRVITATGALNYLDCTLVRHGDGKTRIDDVYNFAEGASFSEIMQRGLALGSDKAATTPKAAGTESESEGAQLGTSNMEMRKLINEGQYQAALDYFQRLPETLQKEKRLLHARIDAAKHLKGKPYDDAVRAYRQQFPVETTTDLILLDAYYEHKMFDRALACIDRIDRAIGGDPYLDALRSGLNRMKGDLDAAKSCAQKAIAAEPDLRQPYFALIQVSLAEKDFTETSRLLTLVQEKFPDHMPSVKTNPVYAGYVKSRQYREWLKAQKQ